jgi:hypothetical protein
MRLYEFSDETYGNSRYPKVMAASDVILLEVIHLGNWSMIHHRRLSVCWSQNVTHSSVGRAIIPLVTSWTFLWTTIG